MYKVPGLKPFNEFEFQGEECFLSGLPAGGRVSVFPEWLMERYALRERPFSLLDERMSTYGALQVPCHPVIRRAAGLLEEQAEQAFAGGLKGMESLSDHELFLWTGKLLLGLVYQELEVAAREKPAGASLDVAPSLLAKLCNLQVLMQSLYRPVSLENFTPWTVVRAGLQQTAPEHFAYRDELNTLIFSMEAGDCGLIVCMQDNGENSRYQETLLSKIKGQTLHPIQFRELCARFYYSAYLFNRVPRYLVYPPQSKEEAVGIESMPLQAAGDLRPLFDEWDNKVYAQVLEDFWKPWGVSRFEILKNPGKPLSYLLDEEGNFIKKCVPPGGDTHY